MLKLIEAASASFQAI